VTLGVIDAVTTQLKASSPKPHWDRYVIDKHKT